MKRLKALSLFTGAGGLDYGFEAAGFDTIAAIEMDHDCCMTLCKNREWPVIEKPVEEVTTKEIIDAGGTGIGDIDILIGGPPCQPFSKSGYWSMGDTKRLKDPRSNTLTEYMRIVEEFAPKAILLENVAGMTFKQKDEGFQLLLSMLEKINRRIGTSYVPHYTILNMAEYGIPQIRQRFFLIASRYGKDFQFPEKTHYDPQSVDSFQQKLFSENKSHFNTAWDAIGHLDPEDFSKSKVGGRWGDLLPSIPEGENYLWHTDRKGGLNLFGWRTRYWGFLLKLARHLPAWTIQAQPGSAIGPFHWDNRKLTTRELLKLMTFPDIEMFGGSSSIRKQLGNAVPSLMTEILGREISKQFFKRSKAGALTLMPHKNEQKIISLETFPVPNKYLKMVGDHAAHPGTGKGPMAIARGKALKRAAKSAKENRKVIAAFA